MLWAKAIRSYLKAAAAKRRQVAALQKMSAIHSQKSDFQTQSQANAPGYAPVLLESSSDEGWHKS